MRDTRARAKTYDMNWSIIMDGGPPLTWRELRHVYRHFKKGGNLFLRNTFSSELTSNYVIVIT